MYINGMYLHVGTHHFMELRMLHAPACTVAVVLARRIQKTALTNRQAHPYPNTAGSTSSSKVINPALHKLSNTLVCVVPRRPWPYLLPRFHRLMGIVVVVGGSVSKYTISDWRGSIHHSYSSLSLSGVTLDLSVPVRQQKHKVRLGGRTLRAPGLCFVDQ